MHPIIQNILMRAADAVIDRRPQPVPSPCRLAQCRLVSHRGQHDNRSCMENTLGAFQRAAEAGVWGIELDIRWTSDLHPVVFHDPDLLRLHGSPLRIDALPLARLQEQFSTIPSLAQVVARFGNRAHLMIEVKQTPWPDKTVQSKRLARILAPLSAQKDFHLMTMHPHSLPSLPWLPATALVAIAGTDTGRYSRWVLENKWGGLCGHYLLLNSAMAKRHHVRRQSVGTGFAGSRQCLWRELNRGIDWIFTDDAAGLQAMVDGAAEGG